MFVKNILKEELENLNSMKKVYINKLKEIPKGTPVKKRVNNNFYYYLIYRDGKRVKMDYIGKDKEKVKEYKRYSKKRKEYKAKLKQVNEEIKFIERALYERKSI